MLRAICVIQLKDRKRPKELLHVLEVSEAIDQMAIVNSVHWCGYLSCKENCHIFRGVLEFEVECQREAIRGT